MELQFSQIHQKMVFIQTWVSLLQILTSFCMRKPWWQTLRREQPGSEQVMFCGRG